MAKFHGYIGFSELVEVAPGVHQEQITEHEYTGDFLRLSQTWVGSERLNDDLKLSTRVSIVADPFAFANLSSIRYAKWAGVSWKVTDIEHQRPRLILTVGGVYNG